MLLFLDGNDLLATALEYKTISNFTIFTFALGCRLFNIVK